MKKVTGRTRRIQSYMMLSLAIAAWLAMRPYMQTETVVLLLEILSYRLQERKKKLSMKASRRRL